MFLGQIRNLASLLLCVAGSSCAFQVHLPNAFTHRSPRVVTAAYSGALRVVCTSPQAGWTPEERQRNDRYASQLNSDPNAFATSKTQGMSAPDSLNLGLRFNSGPTPEDLAGKSRIFLDSAETEDYAKLLPLGIIYGVTTNPIILERSGVACTISSIKHLASTAFSLGCREFMAQSWGGDNVDVLVGNGLQIASIDPRMVVKVPVTGAGLKAAAILRQQGVRICTTAIFAPHQTVSSVVVGAEYVAVGAEYAAPYVGKDGLAQACGMQNIVDKMNSQTRVLVASLCSAEEVGHFAAMGGTTFTLSADVMHELTAQPLTLEATAAHETSAAASNQVMPQKKIGFLD